MIYTINLLDTTECGPESEFEGFMQKVFLQQGSIDGACGPYSIFMGLLSLGLISYDKITSRTVKGNERDFPVPYGSWKHRYIRGWILFSPYRCGPLLL